MSVFSCYGALLASFVIASAQPCDQFDPALRPVVQSVMQSQAAYLVINEDHDVDDHRVISACLLEHVSSVRSVAFGAEALPMGEFSPADGGARHGFLATSGFGRILEVVERRALLAFGYDPPRDERLTDVELRERSLITRIPNRRDRRAAEIIEERRRHERDVLIFLHVGHSHVSERWTSLPNGDHGWLAAHLAVLSDTDPVTVYQMTADEAAWYERRSRFVFDQAACERPSEQATLLDLREGAVGCVDRDRLQSGHDTDFILLDTRSQN